MNKNFKAAAVTGENDEGKRADRIIRSILSDINLSSVYKEMRSGRIRINGKKIKPDFRVNSGDIISVHISLLDKINTDKINYAENVFTDNPVLIDIHGNSNTKKAKDKSDSRESSSLSRTDRINKNFQSSIIFENSNILAVNKKRGIPVHGGTFSKGTETLEDCVKLYLEGKIADSITFSPGPLHRLDRNTSGIILFGKSIKGARVFSEMLRSGKTEKYYIAVFDGTIKQEVRWENIIAQDKNLKQSVISGFSDSNKNRGISGKKAVTVINPVIFNDKNTLAVVRIPTGRYHQIRKQGQLNSHPLTADRKYGGKQSLPFYLLHSYKLILREFSDITGFNSLTADVPDYFIKNITRFFSSSDIEKFINYIENLKD